MDEPTEEFDDTAELARQELGRQRVLQQQRDASRKTIKTLGILASAAVALIGVILAVLFVPREASKPQVAAAPPSVVAPPPQSVVDQLTPERLERKASLGRSWALIRDIPPVGRFKPLLEAAAEKGIKAQQLWTEERFTDADHAFDEFSEAIGAVEQLYQARDLSRDKRQSALDVALEAEQMEAADEAEPLLLTGLRALLTAERSFDQEKYEAAIDHYDLAGRTLAQTVSAARRARAIKLARARMNQEMTRRFDRATLIEFGGEPWKKVAALLEGADRALAESRFDDAANQLASVKESMRDLERAVELAIGGHYFALVSGYRAADLLLVRAAGKTVKPEMVSPLLAALKDLGVNWPEDWTVQIQSADYAKTATLLTTTLAESVRAIGGEAAEGSFSIGVQIRLIQRLVASESPASLRQDIVEIRHSLGIMSKIGQDLGYPPKFGKLILGFSEKLAIKPEFEAMLQSQVMIGQIVRQVADFDDMMPLLPRGLRQK